MNTARPAIRTALTTLGLSATAVALEDSLDRGYCPAIARELGEVEGSLEWLVPALAEFADYPSSCVGELLACHA